MATTSLANSHALHAGNHILTKQDIQKIDSEVIDTVFGFIRNAESSLSRKCIPNGIAVICLSYYWIDTNEYFANAHSDYLTINSEQEISIERLLEYHVDGSAFGNVLIPSQFGGVYTWRFRICQWGEFCIGISTEYMDTDNIFSRQKEGHNYSIDGDGSFLKNGKEVSEVLLGDNPGDIDDKDVLTMTLDLNKRALTYKCVVEEDEGFSGFKDQGFDDVVCGSGICYKMAFFCGEESKFQIIDFCIE